jgi:hypothetical protein
MKLKPNKQTSTDEKQFNKFLAGKKMIIIEKNLEIKKNLVDKSIYTEEEKKNESLNNKINYENIENKKPKNNDLIDLDELKKLEDKFNEIKSATTNSLSNTVGSINRPRRQAPPPPLPKHMTNNETNTIKNSQEVKHQDQSTQDTLKVNSNSNNKIGENEINQKIFDKIDKNLSTRERDLFTKSLNLPLNLDWKHDPQILYKQTCHYLAFYLGTSKIKNLQGAVSSQQCIRDYRKLLNENKLSSLTAVILSISYKSVRCVDVNYQVSLLNLIIIINYEFLILSLLI